MNKVKNDSWRVAIGVPTPANVDYDRIYKFNSKIVDFENVFEKYLANRGGRVDELDNHIQSIKKTIVHRGNMDKFPPIIVDINTLRTADGNCRLIAVCEAIRENLLDEVTIRVIFEDIPENEFDERVIELNMGQKSWGLLDFIYNYSMRGNDNFTRLIDFCNRNETLHSADGKKINPRYAAAVLKKQAKDLKLPTFSLSESEVETGNEIAYEAAQIRLTFSKDAKSNGGGWYEPYLKAWTEFRTDKDGLCEIPFNVYLKQVKKTVERRKSKVSIPLGSHKKQEWNTFFRAVKSFCIDENE